jgi:long-chain acyl-CoA synthetase
VRAAARCATVDSMNLTRTFAAAAQRHPGRVALRLGAAALTYAELERRSAEIAGALLERGLRPGDRVGLMLPNGLHFPVLYAAILRAGAIVVPMNPMLRDREVRFHLADSGAREVFVWHDVAAEAPDAAIIVDEDGPALPPAAGVPMMPRDAGDTAVVLYTSGTTGTPKGAELTHANLARNLEVAGALFGLDERSVVLGALPLFHAFGQTCGMNATLAAGGTLTLVPRFDAAVVLETIEADRVTVFQGVPSMYGALLHHPRRADHDVSSLRTCVSGGAALPVELLHAFERAFGATILEGYGLSETSPIASFNHPDRERRPGSIGTPVAGVEMKVVGERGEDLPAGAVGEILVRGHNVMKGYWNRPEATAAAITPDGWLRTGDLARIDPAGRFYVVDRKKDLIIRGGYNVYPREVEEVLHEHPAVREAAVVGIPDERLGEEVVAAVALADGEAATPEQLREFVRGQLAAYKYPRHVWIVDELPKGPTGKILRRELVARVAVG